MVDPQKIPHENYGGSGAPLHFLHANGYPPGAYRKLLGLLALHSSTTAMYMRPMWADSCPSEVQDWIPLADDLEQYLDNQSLSGLIGVGHSMGATTTLRLALRQPERFSTLVLIDPVFFPPWMIVMWDLLFRLNLIYKVHPLVKSAQRRRVIFDSIEDMYANYRSKPVFELIDDSCLKDYVNAIAQSRRDGKVELAYKREWETQIYVSGIRADIPIWRKLHSLKPPTLIIRGANTNTFWSATAERFRKRLPSTQIISIPNATHLVPLERPQEVFKIIMDFLEPIL